MLKNVLNFAFAWRFSTDCGVAQYAVVERLLCFAGFFTRVVLAQRNAMVQVQVEMLKRTMLNAESAQSRAVNLSCEVFQQQPCGKGSSIA